MKTYEDVLAWMKVVEDYRRAAPEGMAACVSSRWKDKEPTLRNVDPKVITRFVEEQQDSCKAPKVEGSEDESYYKATVTFGKHVKLSRTYCLFYRPTSQNEVADNESTYVL